MKLPAASCNAFSDDRVRQQDLHGRSRTSCFSATPWNPDLFTHDFFTHPACLSPRRGDQQHLEIMEIVGCNSAIPDKRRHIAIYMDRIPAAVRIYGSSQGTRRVRQVQGDRFQHQRPTCSATSPIDGTMIDSADSADSVKLSVCSAMPVAVAGVMEMMFVRKRRLPRGGRRCKLTCRDTLSQIQYEAVLARMIRKAFPASHGLHVCAFHRVCTSRTPTLANRVGFDINPQLTLSSPSFRPDDGGNFVPFQKISWLVDAISRKERSDDSVSSRVELEVSRREGMAALLSHL
jgi:hypothetical protein